jgi:hypothetical protein
MICAAEGGGGVIMSGNLDGRNSIAIPESSNASTMSKGIGADR